MNADAGEPRNRKPNSRKAFEDLTSTAQLEDRPFTPFADAVLTAGRETESFRYFISVGRVVRAALKRKTEAGRAKFVVDQAEQAPAHLGVGVILRHSEAFAAWTEGKWNPPESMAAENAALEARRIAVLAFVADVRTGIGGHGTGGA